MKQVIMVLFAAMMLMLPLSVNAMADKNISATVSSIQAGNIQYRITITSDTVPRTLVVSDRSMSYTALSATSQTAKCSVNNGRFSCTGTLTSGTMVIDVVARLNAPTTCQATLFPYAQIGANEIWYHATIQTCTLRKSRMPNNTL